MPHGVLKRFRNEGVTMLNVHAVAATLAVVSGVALLADKPAWAVVYVVVATLIEVKALRR